MDAEIILTDGQQKALDLMNAGRNVFLTGQAGTGKTFVLRKFLEEAEDADKKVVVCAPTGLAAIAAGGATIQRTFGLKTGVLSDKKLETNDVLRGADVLVIDEVSMCRYDLFHAVALAVARASRGGRQLQVVAVGDFLQLRPVVTEDEAPMLKKFYGARGYREGWCFECPDWERLGLEFVELTEVVRQSEAEYLENLNMARVGDGRCVEFFNERCYGNEVDGAIQLFPTKDAVSQANEAALATIEGEVWEHRPLVDGKARLSDSPCDEVLRLKVGARVMGTKNTNDIEDGSTLFLNGSFGTVTRIDSERGLIAVDWDDFKPSLVAQAVWDAKEYSCVEGPDGTPQLRERRVGFVKQYPLKLAYAITIHKSQGQTFSAVRINPRCFAAGQLYVALSRCRSLEGMCLTEPIEERWLAASRPAMGWLAAQRAKPVALPGLDLGPCESQDGEKDVEPQPSIEGALSTSVRQSLMERQLAILAEVMREYEEFIA